MAGYFGTEEQLQARAEAQAPFIRATPGACQNGRMLGCDDLDRFGFDRIDEALAEDGVVGFRLIPAPRAEELRMHLAGRSYRFDIWDVFIASAAEALPVSEAIVQGAFPIASAICRRRPMPVRNIPGASRRPSPPRADRCWSVNSGQREPSRSAGAIPLKLLRRASDAKRWPLQQRADRVPRAARR